jgi:hypothetical protein
MFVAADSAGRDWRYAPRWLWPASAWVRRTAQALGKNKDDEWWLKFHEDRLVGLIRRFGADSLQAASARADIATKLEGLGRLEEGRLLREEVVAAHRRNMGEEHPQTLVAEAWLVQNLMSSELSEQARPIALHVYDTRRRIQGHDHEDTLRAKRFLEEVGGP